MSLTKLCGLFQRTDKRGDLYLTGVLGMGKLTVNKNLFKRKPSDPDYYLCLVPNDKADDKADDKAEPKAGDQAGG